LLLIDKQIYFTGKIAVDYIVGFAVFRLQVDPDVLRRIFSLFYRIIVLSDRFFYSID
jgi:hypothetical protein